LDTYAEYSYSGDGCHLLGLGDLDEKYRKNKRKVIVKQIPGCKQIEIKSAGFYFVYTGRHLAKTPADLMPREAQLDALCTKVSAVTKEGLTIAAPDEAARFAKLWAGDKSDYADNHSVADLALVSILARRFNNNAFLIDAEFCKSGLFREKWERLDYKWSTIWKVIKDAEVAATFDDEEPMDEDGPTEYLVEALSDGHEGWAPFGECSLIGAPSGAGKTYFALTVLEKARKGEEVWGHKTTPREYRALLHDRSKKAMGRTIRHMKLPQEMVDRIVRLTPTQQKMTPAEALQSLILDSPGIQVWFIEGLDLWSKNMVKMEVLSAEIDALQRVATKHNVCVLATVGAPKMKGDERYFGRDALYGSSVLARKVETVILIALTNREDADSVRQYDVYPRNGKMEKMYMKWEHTQGLVLTEKPPDLEPERKVSKAMAHMTRNCFHKFKAGDEIVYSRELGSEGTFYRWRDDAVDVGAVVRHSGSYYMGTSGSGVVTSA
jgi:isochorismate hydrolase